MIGSKTLLLEGLDIDKLSEIKNMKTVMIVGNGFNYMIESWIRNYPDENIPPSVTESKDKIASRVNEITQLWKKFNEIFKEIKAKNPGIGDEELIRIIYSIIDLFSSLPGLEKVMTSDQLASLKSLFENFLLDKIKEIALEFKNHHDNTGYKNIKRLFPEFGNHFSQMITNHKLDDFHIFTTNYDGILDTLLTDNPHGFIFKDGFGSMGSDELLDFCDYNIEFDKIICHLHGSYRYKRHYGTTYKLKHNVVNTDPIMIFNNPDMKERIIRRDCVLNRYLDLLKEDISTANKIIIFGNSMVNEPHIKQMINKYGDRKEISIYVCSPNPVQIKTEIEPYFQYDIVEVNTTGMTNMNEFFMKFDAII